MTGRRRMTQNGCRVALLGYPSLRRKPFSPLLSPTPPDLPHVNGTVKNQMTNAFSANLPVLKKRAFSAASAPLKRAGKLTGGKPFPVGRGDIALDPDWALLGIPGLRERLSSD